MNPCDNTQLQSELKAYLDGQLPFVLRQRVRRHLRTCAACREELSAMEQISNQLRTDGPQPLGASLRDRILNALSTSDTATSPDATSAPRPKSRWRRRPMLIWAGAATVLVGWFTLYPLLHGDLMRSIAPGGMTAGSNAKSLGLATGMYTQDYDETVASGMKSAAPAAASAGAPVAPAPDRKMEMMRKQPISRETQQSQLNYMVNSDTPQAEEARNIRSADTDVHASNQNRPNLYNPHSNTGGFVVAQNKHHQKSAVPVHRNEAFGAAAGKIAVPLAQPQNLADEAEPIDRQVHREATMTVQVDNVEAKSEAATQYIQTAGGFVASNELNTGEDDTKTASLTLKVPVAQFEAVLNQIARLGEVKAKNVTGEDLTEKISDQEQAEHVLKQDIGTTQEELTHRLSRSAHEERMDTLRELRIRVARARARLQLLHKLGALSTITLELNEKPRPAPAPKTGGFMDDMNNTLHGAAQSMMQAARLPILTFIWILAYSPLWILLIVGYRYAVRR